MPLHRRAFLGTSARGLAAALAAGPAALLAQHDLPRSLEPPPPAGPPTPLDGLFLTWQRDPTTTMTVQWVGPDAPGETIPLHYVTPSAAAWSTAKTAVKPFPGTDLKVFRAELSGLAPGTDYLFRVGPNSPVHRFRTMPAKATDTITFVSGGDCGVNA